jgi:hypothetical protein
MDVLTRMVDHHLDLTAKIIDHSCTIDPTVLDRPIELSVEGIDRDPTLRSVADRLVSQLEMWLAATAGESSAPAGAPSSPEQMRTRLAVAGPRFRELVVSAIDEGRVDDAFLDATCEPPQTFTYGGMIAHVLTFAAVRRTLAIGALESAGVSGLGSGDPMNFVGGQGDDASSITRRDQQV